MVISSFAEIDFHNIAGILLDLDDTVYSYAPCHHASLTACCHHFLEIEKLCTEEDFLMRYQKARQYIGELLAGKAASHSRLLYFQKLFEDYYNGTKFDLGLQFENLYWDTFLNTMKLRPDALTFLKLCKEKDVKVCLVTDLTAAIQHKKVLRLNISPFIDYMVTSEESGVEKPNARIFEIALRKLDINASDVIMIGDNEEKDIVGAGNLGIKTYHLR